MKVLLGSNSNKSINKKVVDYLKENVDPSIEYIDLLKEDVVIYSLQLEKKLGIPKYIKQIYKQIQNTDETILLAVPEHNGNLTAFYKNIFDWLTRIDQRVFNEKKVKVLCVTPGSKGGASIRGILETSLPYFGAKEVKTYGLASFYDVFIDGKIKNQKVEQELKEFIIK